MQIEGLRGVCIIIIAFYHFFYRYCEIYEKQPDAVWLQILGSQISVFCFLIISSFFLLPPKTISTLTFIKKKLYRLWPSYAISILITFVILKIWELPGREIGFKTFILSFAGVPGFMNGEYVDGAHWYMMVLCGLIISMSLLHFLKVDRLWWSSILWLLIGTQLYYLGIIPLYRIIGGSYIGICVIGLSYRLLIEGEASKWEMLVVFAAGCIYTKLRLGSIVVLYVIIAFTIFYLCNNRRISLLDNALLRYVAGYSYSWYLIHQNVGMDIEYYLRKHYSTPLPICITVAMAVTFCLAVFITKADQVIRREVANGKK